MHDTLPQPSATETGLPQLLGIRFMRAEKDQIVGEMEARAEHTTASGGRVHGGLLMAFADTLGAMGTVMNMPAGHWTSTIESKTNFLAAAKVGRLRGIASPVHVGRTTQVWRTDVSDSSGRTVAIITQTQLVLPKSTPDQAPAESAAIVDVPAQKKANGSIPDQRRRQIFEAASKVFGRKGFSSTSVRDIAEAAEMPVPTMYQYFRSKEDILALVFETYMLEIGNSIRTAADAQTSAVAKLEAAIEANLAMYDKYRRQIRLMYQETRSLGPDNRTRALDLTRTANQVWSDVIREGIDAGVFRVKSPDVVANFIPMLCASWVLRRWNMNGASLAELRDALVDLVLHGLGGAREGKPRARPAAKRRARK
jgi:uncharacterized protein (TIGR00369 family)